MTTLKQIMAANYEAVKGRGLIDDETTLPEFITKLQEEIGEFIKAKDENEAAAELADIVGVCLNIASHYEIDLPAELGVMVRRNENRIINIAGGLICEKAGIITVLIDAIHESEINKSLFYKRPIQVIGIGRGVVIYYKHSHNGLVVDLIRSRP
jgi:NTP pyrophosphatase (non-canonical NTP hydrolase)